MNKKQKIFSFQDISKYRTVLMGLEILLIIAFHFTADCKEYDIRFSGIISLFYNYIHSSGVDLFLFLSGFGLYFSWKKNPNPKSFYKKRFLRVLVPYFIVAIPSWYWLDFCISQKGAVIYIEDLFFITFFSNGTRVFWFILMIVICYLLFPYLFQVIDQASDKITEQMRVIILSTAIIIFTVMLQLYDNDLYSNISLALCRFPMFIVGILTGKAAYEFRTTARHNLYILTAFTILLIGPLKMYNISIIGFLLTAILNLCLCFSLIIFLNFLESRKNRGLTTIYGLINQVLNWFGQYTLEIYLLHVIVHLVLNQYGFYTYRLLYEMIEVLLSVILAVILNKISNLIYKKLTVTK